MTDTPELNGQQQQVDLNALTLDQLKALAYDQIVMIENCQANVRAINDRIAQLTPSPAGVPLEALTPPPANGPNRAARRAGARAGGKAK